MIWCEMKNEMTLREKQSKFVQMTWLLILFIYEQGYELTYGPAYETTGHMEASLHGYRLAMDLNLFKDGEWLKETEDHKIFGEFWEKIGGTWGGRFNDGNHYSLGHDGKM